MVWRHEDTTENVRLVNRVELVTAESRWASWSGSPWRRTSLMPSSRLPELLDLRLGQLGLLHEGVDSLDVAAELTLGDAIYHRDRYASLRGY